MKDLVTYILEGRTINEIKIKDVASNKEIEPKMYAFDKNSLDKLIEKYKNNNEYWNDKSIHLTSVKNKSTWEIDSTEEYKFKVYQQNDDFFYSDNNTFTYDDLIDMIENESKMIIVINKNI